MEPSWHCSSSEQNKSVPFTLNRPLWGKHKPFSPQSQGCRGRR